MPQLRRSASSSPPQRGGPRAQRALAGPLRGRSGPAAHAGRRRANAEHQPGGREVPSGGAGGESPRNLPRGMPPTKGPAPCRAQCARRARPAPKGREGRLELPQLPRSCAPTIMPLRDFSLPPQRGGPARSAPLAGPLRGRRGPAAHAGRRRTNAEHQPDGREVPSGGAGGESPRNLPRGMRPAKTPARRRAECALRARPALSGREGKLEAPQSLCF